jgi:hypothetical protein
MGFTARLPYIDTAEGWLYLAGVMDTHKCQDSVF